MNLPPRPRPAGGTRPGRESDEASAAVYDLRGLTCPLPVLKARKRLSAMQSGETLWLETTDPLAVLDIPAFCREAGHGLVVSEATDGGHRFLVRRA